MDKIVKEYFKQLSKEKMRILCENLRIVQSGLKPGFLFDLGSFEIGILNEFVREVNKIEESDLKVLIVNNLEAFIIKQESVIKNLNKALTNEIVFINVTSGLKVPEVMTRPSGDLTEMFEKTLERLQFGNFYLELEPIWSGVSLYGVILGTITIQSTLQRKD